MDSLLAKAILLACLILLRRGFRQEIPEIAIKEISDSIPENSKSPLSSLKISSPLGSLAFSFSAWFKSLTQTKAGLNSFICHWSVSISWLVERPITLNSPLFLLITFKAFLPIEPVEPNINTFFILSHHCKVQVKCRSGKNQAIHHI